MTPASCLRILGLAVGLEFVAAAPAMAVEAPLTVEGTGFSVQAFTEGGLAYGNRRYVWRNVPAQMAGWRFTRTDGGVRAEIAVTAQADGLVHVATAPSVSGVDLAGWQKVEGLCFHYTDKGRTVMEVFRRTCKAGTKLTVPQGNWSGTIVLAPALQGEAKARRQPAPDHSKVPGAIIDYSPARTGKYVGSPGIAVLANGGYAASHDIFGRGSRQRVTRVFRSSDRGRTWTHLTDVDGQWWSTLFGHQGALYLIGTSRSYGFTVIRRSADGGKTWTEPKDAGSGLLLGDGKYHCAPVPVLVHNGRIWRAMEDAMGPGAWGSHFRSFMMSAPADANLLKAANWTFSNRLGRDPKWLDGEFGGWLEGNAVATPDGHVVNILRVDHNAGGKAAVIRISGDGKTATFDPKTGFIAFPGGSKKFTIRYDPKSRRYWSLVNWVQDKDRPKHAKASLIRNTLALVSSPDLAAWTVRSVILYHGDVAKHGFQYVDWLFEGDDLIAASRTAYDDGLGGAHNQHDANYLTFHRIRNFRTMTMTGSVPSK
jgi:hypothetical protein